MSDAAHSPERRAGSRGEFLDLPRLQVAARQLATTLFQLEPTGSRWQSGHHLHRLDRQARSLAEVYRTVADDVHRGETISPAAEWLLDNFHLITNEVRTVHHDLPPGYYRRLPHPAGSGSSRLEAIADDLIRHSDGRLDADRLRGYVQAFQSVSPLTIGELWAWPSVLKAALIAHVAGLAEGIRRSRDENVRADAYIAKLDDGSSSRLGSPVADATSLSFIVRLLQRIREYGPHVAALRTDIDQWLALRQMTPEDAIRIEGQHEAADQVSMANTITSLRFAGALDWSRFFESVSQVEHILRRDPSGTYGRMDFVSRDQYRRVVEQLGGAVAGSQVRVALDCVDAARRSGNRGGDPRHAHVGYYLAGPGRQEFERLIAFRPRLGERARRALFAHATGLYLGAIALLMVLVIAGGIAYAAALGHGTARTITLITLFALIPASELATRAVQRLLPRLIAPRVLPRLELDGGVPEDGRTMVIVPTLFGSVRAVDELLAHLEIQALGNLDPRIHFALLSDFTDALTEHRPDDADILAAARAGIDALNHRHPSHRGSRFYLFHRDRQWNEKEGMWMGWERKRGKIEEFNRLLRGASDTGFRHTAGDLSILADVRYCITLDTDTQLPRDAAKTLIGIALHPLNQPQIDRTSRRVTEGYGILQPRVSVTMSSAAGSVFARVYAGHTGVDPYTTAVSDTYQDLFEEGVFAGKGLYHVDAFKATLDGRVPENALLSHDLFEGLHARVALVTDLEVVDDFPATVLAHARRQRRWVRGDWQILWWLFPWVPAAGGVERNHLPLISRWKILDNLRRSLLAPALLGLLVLGWTTLPGRPWFWTTLTLVVLGTPVLLTLARLLTFPWLRQPLAVLLRRLAEDLETSFAQAILSLMLLPYHAWEMGHAIILTLIRLVITQRRLLEWETAASVAVRLSTVEGRTALRTFIMEMAASPLIAIGILATVAAVAPRSLTVALPFVALWVAAPAVAYLLSRPVVPPVWVLSARDRRRLRQIARRTWHYFELFVGPESHWLPPDNFQETPDGGLARRTSPTNIGMGLLSTLAAHDLGFIDASELVERLEAALDTIERLERHEGHLLNWYETHTLAALWPRYVSTVDSGNLVAALMALDVGLHEVAPGTVGRDALLAGLDDAAELVRASLPAIARAFAATPTVSSSIAVVVEAVQQRRGLAGDRDVETAFVEEQGGALDRLLAEFDDQSIPDHELKTPPPLSTVRALRAALRRLSHEPAPVPRDALVLLGIRCRALADSMRFGFLYDRTRQLFAIGYRLPDADGPGRLDASYYDLLASEARLASFVAIAAGDVPQAHWFRLGRLAVSVDGVPTLLSWSATMFEYLMPSLLMRSFPDTLLDQTSRRVVRRQIQYGRRYGIPWGISESAYGVVDRQGTYQVQGVWHPGAGPEAGPGRRSGGRSVRHRPGASREPDRRRGEPRQPRPRGRRGSPRLLRRHRLHPSQDLRVRRVDANLRPPAGRGRAHLHGAPPRHDPRGPGQRLARRCDGGEVPRRVTGQGDRAAPAGTGAAGGGGGTAAARGGEPAGAGRADVAPAALPIAAHLLSARPVPLQRLVRHGDHQRRRRRQPVAWTLGDALAGGSDHRPRQLFHLPARRPLGPALVGDLPAHCPGTRRLPGHVLERARGVSPHRRWHRVSARGGRLGRRGRGSSTPLAHQQEWTDARDRDHELRGDRARAAGRRRGAPGLRQAVHRDRVPAGQFRSALRTQATRRSRGDRLGLPHAQRRWTSPVADRMGEQPGAFSGPGPRPRPSHLAGRSRALGYHRRGARSGRQPAAAGAAAAGGIRASLVRHWRLVRSRHGASAGAEVPRLRDGGARVLDGLYAQSDGVAPSGHHQRARPSIRSPRVTCALSG